MYHQESIGICNALQQEIGNLTGGTLFQIGDISIKVEGKDGLGGLIEEWFGVWAVQRGFNIKNSGSSQQFPDFFIGQDDSFLEIKTFDGTKSPNFDLANFESYCESVANMPSRTDSDYLIFSYELKGSHLSITNIWLKKIWEITCPSDIYPLKIQQKKNVIYNIRPATWYSTRSKFTVFRSKQEFIEALFHTQKIYRGYDYLGEYTKNC